MYLGGTEKAFLSLARNIDYSLYDVDLLLAKREGPLLDEIPKEINVYELPDFGDMFLLSSKNTYKIIWNSIIKKHPGSVFLIFSYFIRLLFSKTQRQSIATRMWIDLMQRYAPEFENGFYDAAIAFWGDRAMFYMVDKVKNAGKYITWLHFDYGNPKRDDNIYLPYFQKCDYIVTVSESVDAALKKALPAVSSRCVAMENLIDSKNIRRLALEGKSFPDTAYKGLRILSVCRLSDQKGVDFIPPVLHRLRKEGYDLRWYVIGDGEKEYKLKLVEDALRHSVLRISFFYSARKIIHTAICAMRISLLLPSRFEGRPITVEEAKIMMRPIIVSRYVSAESAKRR